MSSSVEGEICVIIWVKFASFVKVGAIDGVWVGLGVMVGSLVGDDDSVGGAETCCVGLNVQSQSSKP